MLDKLKINSGELFGENLASLSSSRIIKPENRDGASKNLGLIKSVLNFGSLSSSRCYIHISRHFAQSTFCVTETQNNPQPNQLNITVGSKLKLMTSSIDGAPEIQARASSQVHIGASLSWQLITTYTCANFLNNSMCRLMIRPKLVQT